MHVSNIFLFKKAFETIGPVGANNPKIHPSLEARGRRGPHVIHQCLGSTHSLPQMTARSVHALLHNYATMSSLVTMGCPKFTPKLPVPLQ